MTSDVYDSDDALNRSPQLVAQKVNYQVEEPRPPFARPESPKRNATGKDAAGTPGRSRKLMPESNVQTRLGDSVLMRFLEPNRPDIWEFEEKDPLNQPWPPPDRNPLEDRKPVQKKEESLKQTAEEAVHQLQPKDPPGLETKPVSSPVAVQPPGMKKELNSPGQRPRLPPISALDTSLGDPPRFFPPHGDSTKCSPEEPARVSLPSLQSPQSSTNFPDQKNTQSLPSIQSALSGLTPTEFPPSRINGLPPPYPYPGTAGSMAPRHDPPHDRRISGPLPPHHIPPSPFSHFSPTSAKDMSNNPSPASQPTFWRRPSQSQAEMGHGTSPYEMPPVSAQSPTTGYPTPTEHVNAVPGELTSLSSNPSTAGTGTTGNYKCSHPGCTAASFQTQYLLK